MQFAICWVVFEFSAVRISLLPYRARQRKVPIATTISGCELFNRGLGAFDLFGCESRDIYFLSDCSQMAASTNFFSRANRHFVHEHMLKRFSTVKQRKSLNLRRRSIFQFFLGKVLPTPLPSRIFAHRSLSRSALVVPSENFCVGKSSLCRKRLGESLLTSGTMKIREPRDEIGFSRFFQGSAYRLWTFAKTFFDYLCLDDSCFDASSGTTKRTPKDESLLEA